MVRVRVVEISDEPVFHLEDTFFAVSGTVEIDNAMYDRLKAWQRAAEVLQTELRELRMKMR